MFKALLRFVRQPETQAVLWRWPLPFWLTVSYVVATLTGLLMVTTWREDDLSNPDSTSLILASIIGSLVTLWAIRQNMRSAILNGASKSSSLTVTRLLSLQPSRTRPLWVMWLAAFSVVIVIDVLTLILGRPQTSFPSGLDRIENAAWTTWVLAGILFVVLRPSAEELIFRGILYPVLARQFNDNLKAVLATAGLFTALYFAQVFSGDFEWGVVYWGLIYPLALSIVAGIARAHTKSTFAAIGAHVMFGLFVVLSALLNLA